jgi:diacylglycerol kinase family enzyme
MRNIIYIINPVSGTKTKKGLEQFIAEQTKKRGFSFEIFPSVASGDYSFLHTIIKEKKITDVVIVGGDGTISPVVSSLMDCKCKFWYCSFCSEQWIGLCC